MQNWVGNDASRYLKGDVLYLYVYVEINYSSKCYYSRLWDFVWWYAPYAIFVSKPLHQSHKDLSYHYSMWYHKLSQSQERQKPCYI